MKWKIFLHMALTAVVILAWCGAARAEGRAGSVEWSDGRKAAGAISLTPGKSLRLFTATGQVSVSLDEVKDIRFKVEKEEMWEGFYFPNAGQATQVKTGEVYPIRYLRTEITLGNGQVVEGHLFTTTLYIETDDATEKVVLMAKQTGANGQKLADLVYPTRIGFDAGAVVAGSSRIDLTQAGFANMQPPVIVTRPDLAPPPMEQAPGKPVWTVPVADPGRLFFAVEAGDGIHVAWPEAEADPARQQAAAGALKVMQDFYDTRTALGCFADGDDVYSLVMMKRAARTDSFSAGKIPWSLVILRWKYDPDEKKATLLNRVTLATGRAKNNSPLPAVFKQPELLKDVSVGK
ncbi:MAG TPA: hypothetical protein VGZ93_05320 [Candidatus Methylacidiphilales bacterium]|jgi:hypothetical protein|nr:hypothetical protein [Candidatus Methylacidiphilales bacterium]